MAREHGTGGCTRPVKRRLKFLYSSRQGRVQQVKIGTQNRLYFVGHIRYISRDRLLKSLPGRADNDLKEVVSAVLGKRAEARELLALIYGWFTEGV